VDSVSTYVNYTRGVKGEGWKPVGIGTHP
jgi:hypothetical protein